MFFLFTYFYLIIFHLVILFCAVEDQLLLSAVIFRSSLYR